MARQYGRRTLAGASPLLWIAGALLFLAGCGSTPPAAERSTTPASPPVPVPVLKVGEAFAADLMGDGRATITVSGVEISDRPVSGDPPLAGDVVHLVVTVKFLLDRPGEPIAGGPANFRFRDASATLHTARTSEASFPPGLAPVNLTAAGQQASGRLFFDVPPESVGGGHIQLMTGRIVHAVWRV